MSDTKELEHSTCQLPTTSETYKEKTQQEKDSLMELERNMVMPNNNVKLATIDKMLAKGANKIPPLTL